MELGYYGPWEITAIEENVEEMGVKGKRLSFAPEKHVRKDADGKDEEIIIPIPDRFVPDRIYSELITEQPLDEEKHWYKKRGPLARDIKNILRLHNVTVGLGNGVRNDMQDLFQYIEMQSALDRQRVLDTFWGVNPHFQTILQLDKLMLDLGLVKEIPAKE